LFGFCQCEPTKQILAEVPIELIEVAKQVICVGAADLVADAGPGIERHRDHDKLWSWSRPRPQPAMLDCEVLTNRGGVVIERKRCDLGCESWEISQMPDDGYGNDIIQLSIDLTCMGSMRSMSMGGIRR
jgi:hypothetical protein